MSGALNNVLQAVMFQPTRMIVPSTSAAGIIIPDCAIEERGVDRLSITRHPVEQGANISDHAYQEQPEVTLRWSWSNSSPANAISSGIGPLGLLGFGSETYINKVYETLMTLQASRIRFTLVTGKRLYTDMLLASLLQTTDKESAYCLNVVAICTQLFVVQTRAAQLPPTADQKNPKQTGGTENRGSQAPNSNPDLQSNLFSNPPTGSSVFPAQVYPSSNLPASGVFGS